MKITDWTVRQERIHGTMSMELYHIIKVLKNKINCLSKNIHVDTTFTKLDYISNTVYMEQQVYTLFEQLASIPVFESMMRPF
jgi:hypothetical protein